MTRRAYHGPRTLLLAFLWPALGWAQEIQLSGPLAGAPAVSKNPGAKTADGFVVPSGHVELGGDLLFITSGPSLDGQALDFTDVGIARLRARRSFGDSLELSAATELLAKQPSYTDEPIWQGASLGTTLGISGPWGASAAVGLGPLLSSTGWWWSPAAALVFRPTVEREPVHFAVSLGDRFTALDFSDSAQGSFWMNEIFASAEVQLGGRDGGMWIGFDYAVPVVHDTSESSAPGTIVFDPPVRLSAEIGGVWRLRRAPWDLFTSLTIIDRGELEDPTTTLPILNGGFDQQQLLFGVQYRFEDEADEERGAYW